MSIEYTKMKLPSLEELMQSRAEAPDKKPAAEAAAASAEQVAQPDPQQEVPADSAEQTQETAANVPAQAPAAPKRGRPRKDEAGTKPKVPAPAKKTSSKSSSADEKTRGNYYFSKRTLHAAQLHKVYTGASLSETVSCAVEDYLFSRFRCVNPSCMVEFSVYHGEERSPGTICSCPACKGPVESVSINSYIKKL